MTHHVDTTTGALATAEEWCVDCGCAPDDHNAAGGCSSCGDCYHPLFRPVDTGPCEAAERCVACGGELCDEHGVGEYAGCPDYVLCAGCLDYCGDCARQAGLDRAAEETLGAIQEGDR